MGIYPSGIIYGINIYKVIDDEVHNLFKRQYNDVMDYNTRKEAKDFYEKLSKTNQNNLRFSMYTPCSSPGEDDFMMWYPISFDVFKEKFYC